MRPRQELIIRELHAKLQIDPAGEARARIEFLKDYLAATGAEGYVLGISGGQDSTLAGRLAQLAVEEIRAAGGNATFVAVRLPYRVQRDEDDAQLALRYIRPDESVTFDIAAPVDAVAAEYGEAMGVALSDFSKGNVKARARMVAQYAIAGDRRLLVLGTDHAAEAITGFFTKFGDGGADVLPLTGLTKRQGAAVLLHLDGPEHLTTKAPTADLLDEAPQQADEVDLGLRYRDIDDYLEGHDVSDAVAEAIESRFWATRHKRTVPVSMFDEWWRS